MRPERVWIDVMRPFSTVTPPLARLRYSPRTIRRPCFFSQSDSTDSAAEGSNVHIESAPSEPAHWPSGT